MTLGFTRNPISYWQPVWLILITFYILTNNTFINAQEVTVPTDEEKVEFAQNTTKYAVDFLGAVIEENMIKNMVPSPFSIQICLGVIDLAVDLQTSITLNKYLPTRKAFENVLQLYGNNNSHPRIASKLFYNKRNSILDSFKYGIETYFHSKCDAIYIEDDQNLQTHHSSWLKSEGTPSTQTTFTVRWNGGRRLIFSTLMNFSNEWLHKFVKAKLEWYPIETNNDTTIRYKRMMNTVGYFHYAFLRDFKTEAIKLPFRDERLSMLILLPNLDSNVYELQKGLTVRRIREILDRLVYTEVGVKLPKFSVDFTDHYTDTLSEMGLASLYSAKLHILDNREFLRVESIVQTNKFVINEAGINTQTPMGIRINTSPTTRFYANRPFIFFIQDNEGHTFYAGKVTDF